MQKYILALDQGTTSSKAVLIDNLGKIVSKAQFETTQYYPQTGWVEQDPIEIVKTQFSAIQEVVAKSRIDIKDIVAVGVTNQRETTVMWDKHTGKPVCGAIVWQCRRTSDIANSLKEKGLEAYIRQNTGLLVDAYFSSTKIRWILDHVEGVKERAQKGDILFGTIDTWLIWNLTRGKTHVTDYSNASRTMLFNTGKLEWDKTLCRELEIPMNILPDVKPSSYIYDKIADGVPGLEQFAGIPIASAIGDQPSALFGQACFQPGQMKNTYGTGCFFMLNTGENRLHTQNNLLTSVAWKIDGKVHYAIEGSVFNAGSVIKWLRDSLKLIGSARECDTLADSVEDSGGVYFVPAFTGLGAPYWDMYARGTVVGLTRGSTNAHLARSVLESIAYQVTDLYLSIYDGINLDFNELRVDGGASVSDVLMQFQADMLGVPINRPKYIETTAIGAAYMAGLATGVFKSTDEIERFREVDKVFEPNMKPEKSKALYRDWKRAVERSMNWAAI